ncbi:hypothetical protein HDV57DRAFT_119177 [Trichoderma longibrachiatum]|uniref:Uncharacterized protein n=1 Tax=Trichoderma longibrachiatum ATCC 18648 TaxID=983965 RepID=A0A2T4BUG3_TRILO|nr:hypothetical protein M440DRAFT_1086279 [Trichoderma longibrachiatum ATCC 18648]
MSLVLRGGSSDVPALDLTAPGISFSGCRGTWRSPLGGARSLGRRTERGHAAKTDSFNQRPPSRHQPETSPAQATWAGPVGEPGGTCHDLPGSEISPVQHLVSSPC